MPRTARIALGGTVFHANNRGLGQMRLFYKDRDNEAFEEILERGLATCPMRICGDCESPWAGVNTPSSWPSAEVGLLQ